jgi:hypothetical protein
MHILIFGLCIVAGATFLWYFIPRHRRLNRFKNREELSADIIYTEFFATNNLQKELVSQLWNEVASLLHIPPGKLRPSDRFDKELAPVQDWEFDDETLEVSWAAQRRLQKLGIAADISRIQTLRDYVEFFCKLELTRRTA